MEQIAEDVSKYPNSMPEEATAAVNIAGRIYIITKWYGRWFAVVFTPKKHIQRKNKIDNESTNERIK